MAKDLKDYRFTQVAKTWLPEEIYDRRGGIPPVPQGYEVVDFRIALGDVDEPYLGVDGAVYRSGTTNPRFILRPKPTPVVVKPYTASAVTVQDIYECGPEGVTLPEGYEYAGFRKPRSQESILNPLGGVYNHGSFCRQSDLPRIIVKKGEA
jgi:hypothetical protein